MDSAESRRGERHGKGNADARGAHWPDQDLEIDSPLVRHRPAPGGPPRVLAHTSSPTAA